MTKKLNERALRPLVLKDLIHEIISIDEYTPKIADDNIVIGFQVKDNFDAAYDLGSFLERCPMDIVDTEASETPNIDGRYNVFAEFERNAQFPSKMMTLLKIIENICPDPGWKFQVYGHNDPIDATEKKLKNVVELTFETDLKEFFDYAPVQVKVLEESIRIASIYGSTLHYSLSSGLIPENYVESLLKENTSVECDQLSSVLGEEYTVLRTGEEYIVGRNGQYVLLR